MYKKDISLLLCLIKIKKTMHYQNTKTIFSLDYFLNVTIETIYFIQNVLLRHDFRNKTRYFTEKLHLNITC